MTRVVLRSLALQTLGLLVSTTVGLAASAAQVPPAAGQVGAPGKSVVGAATSEVLSCKELVPIEFTAGGRLTSSICPMIDGQKLQFAVNTERGDLSAPSLRTLRRYIEAIDGIEKELEKPKNDPPFGIETKDLVDVRNDLCHEACGLLTNFLGRPDLNLLGEALNYYHASLGVLGCPLTAGSSPPRCDASANPRGLVPAAASLGEVEFAVRTKCYGESGRQADIPDSVLVATPNQPGRLSTPNVDIDPSCRVVDFELRQKNPFPAVIMAWERSHEVPPTLRTLVGQARQELSELPGNSPSDILERWAKDVKSWADLLEKFRRGEQPATPDATIEKMTNDVKQAQGTVDDLRTLDLLVQEVATGTTQRYGFPFHGCPGRPDVRLLHPGESCTTSVSVLYHQGGFAFPRAGRYRLQCRVRGTKSRSRWLASDTLEIEIAEPQANSGAFPLDPRVGEYLELGGVCRLASAHEKAAALLHANPDRALARHLSRSVSHAMAACGRLSLPRLARISPLSALEPIAPGAKAFAGLGERALGADLWK